MLTAPHQAYDALVVLLVVAAALMALTGGVVLALPPQEDCAATECVGTRGDDLLNGTFGNDQIAGMEGNDLIYGSGGGDYIYGDEGNDTIYVAEVVLAESYDTVNCGPGNKEKVFFDSFDIIAKNCEIRKPQ